MSAILEPSVRKYEDNKYSTAEFLAKICKQHGLGFYKDKLLKREGFSAFTWTEWKNVNEFVDFLGHQQHLPPSYREFLLNNDNMIINDGATKTSGPIHTLFPRVTNYPYIYGNYKMALFMILTLTLLKNGNLASLSVVASLLIVKTWKNYLNLTG